MPSPKNIIAASPGVKRTFYKDGDTQDIIRVIMYADKEGRNYVLDGVEKLRGKDDRATLKNCFDFLRQNVRYRVDKPGEEVIKSPANLFSSGYGDCKSFSLALGAMCRALGIKYRYRFTAPDSGDFRHAYPIATTSDGSDIILDAVYGYFNKEARYHHRTDRRPAGISGIGSIFSDGFEVALLLGLTYIIVAKPDLKKLGKKINRFFK